MANVFINPLDWAGDDTTKLQSAIASCGGQGTIILPPKIWNIEDTLLVNRTGTHIKGAGIYSTRIEFYPSSNSDLFSFDSGALLSDCSLSGVYLGGHESYSKTSIKSMDTSKLKLSNIMIYGFDYDGDIGLHLQGRELGTFEKMDISAHQPVLIDTNPNSTISLDTTHFTDFRLIPTGDHYAYTVAPGCWLTSLYFDGYQGCCGGKGIFYWHDSESNNSQQIHFSGGRFEQGLDADSYAFHLVNSCIGVKLDQVCIGDTVGHGFYVREVWNPTLTGCSYTGTGVSLDMDSTCRNVVLMNLYENAPPATRTMTGMTRTFNQPPMEIWQPL